MRERKFLSVDGNAYSIIQNFQKAEEISILTQQKQYHLSLRILIQCSEFPSCYSSRNETLRESPDFFWDDYFYLKWLMFYVRFQGWT